VTDFTSKTRLDKRPLQRAWRLELSVDLLDIVKPPKP
jgi:hypothetical protein